MYTNCLFLICAECALFLFSTLSLEKLYIYYFYIRTFDFHFNIFNTTTDYQLVKYKIITYL